MNQQQSRPRLLVILDEDGNPTAAVSDDPCLSNVKVAFVRHASEAEWDESLERPATFLVQYRNDHETIAHEARLTFFSDVITDQAAIDNMRDMDEWNFDISLLLDSVYRVEQVLIGCEQYTDEHANPIPAII